LNTATRGARQEFPVKALIVAEALKVTIYDMDDPAVPMWMVFLGTGILAYHTSLSAITFRDGVLPIVGSNGLLEVNLLSDITLFRQNGNFRQQRDISTRNTAAMKARADIATGSIISNVVNDVAITTLPGAPIDDQTGLPVPTIAVATAGGVSVIRDDGTVVDSSAGNPVDAVAFDESNNLYLRYGLSIGAIVPEGVYLSEGFAYTYKVDNGAWSATKIPTIGSPQPPMVAGVFSDGGVGAGFVTIAEFNQSTYAGSLYAYTAHNYATGWMHGDVKGAFLCEASEDDLVGGELLTNGTFDTDLSGWTGTGVWDAGTLLQTSGAGLFNLYLKYEIPKADLVDGATYTVTADMLSATVASNGQGLSVYGSNSDGSVLAFQRFVVGGLQKLSITFTYSDSAHSIPQIRLYTGGENSTTSWDNVSLQLANEDRSVNANGLTVNGTITVAPVATGAETMAYSGFSGTNFFSQPYNSALDFGTGDFYAYGWVNLENVTIDSTIFSRALEGQSGGLMLRTISGNLDFFASTTTSYVSIASAPIPPVGSDLFWAVTRKDGQANLFVNGTLVTTAALAGDLDYADAILQFGIRGPGAPLLNPASRFRIGAGAPTPEQIRKIYRDELPLYREDAACTINGTSSAVTAMASDPVTGLLQVGTSGGLSAFRGLQRVEQDTTAVINTISANGATVARQ